MTSKSLPDTQTNLSSVFATVQQSSESSTSTSERVPAFNAPLIQEIGLKCSDGSRSEISSGWKVRKIDAESVINDKRFPAERPVMLVYVKDNYEMLCNPDFSHVVGKNEKPPTLATTNEEIKESKDVDYIISEGFKIKRRHYEKYLLGIAKNELFFS